MKTNEIHATIATSGMLLILFAVIATTINSGKRWIAVFSMILAFLVFVKAMHLVEMYRSTKTSDPVVYAVCEDNALWKYEKGSNEWVLADDAELFDNDIKGIVIPELSKKNIRDRAYVKSTVLDQKKENVKKTGRSQNQ